MIGGFTLVDEDKELQEVQEDDGTSITSLSPRLQRFVHLYMTGHYSVSKMAELFEVHPNTVFRWLNRDDVKHVLAEMQENTHNIVGTQLKSLTMKAVNRLNELIDSPIDGVALQAVNTVLDRGGHKTKSEIKVDKTVTTYEQQIKDIVDTTLTDEEIEEIEIIDEE